MEDAEVFIKLLKKDRRFTIETYRFVNEALEYAQELGLGKESPTERPENGAEDVEESANHVTGQDLCRAAARYAVAEYGMMARAVLSRLGLRKTGDLGDVVYNMIEIGYMTKTPDDSRADFDDVFELGPELDRLFAFEFEGRRKKSRDK